MEGDVRPEHPLLTLASPQIGNRNKTIAIWAPDTVGIPQLVPGSRVCRAVLGRSAVPDPVRSRSVPIRCAVGHLPLPTKQPTATMSLRTVGARLGLRTRTPTVSRTRTYSAFTQKEVDPQLNGYPQLPNESRQSLPAHGWWDNQMRRNYGDTV